MQPAARVAGATVTVGLTASSATASRRRLLVVKLALDLVSDPADRTPLARPRAEGWPIVERDLVPRPKALEAFRPGAIVPLPPMPDAASPEGEQLFTLPDVFPVVELLTGLEESRSAVEMRCDELRREADGIVVVTWRGEASERALARADRAAITLERPGPVASTRTRLGDLARARIGYVVEEEDVGREPTAEDTARLELERYALAAEPAEPLLSLEGYAKIAAELAEGRAPRAATLARSELDEIDWSIEERAWLTRIADAGLGGDPELAIAYGEHFTRAQDAAVPIVELDAAIHAYVAVLVRMAGATDPGRLLGEWSLTLTDWMRLERHWQRRMDADAQLRKEVERMIEDAKRAVAAERAQGEESTA